MTELVEFLRARIADDAEAARDAAGWDTSGRERASGRWQRDGWNSVVTDDGRLVVHGDGPPPDDSDAAHITRWDPARVLAECEAKRQLLEAWDRTLANYPDACRAHTPTPVICGYQRCLEHAVRHLALTYADHADYCEEWRP